MKAVLGIIAVWLVVFFVSWLPQPEKMSAETSQGDVSTGRYATYQCVEDCDTVGTDLYKIYY